jgi:AP-1 complex subunit sigma 1/2
VIAAQDTLIDHAKEQASSLSNIIAQATKWSPPMPRILVIM